MSRLAVTVSDMPPCLLFVAMLFAAFVLIFLCQRVNTATSSPADDVHHYVIPQKLLLTNRLYFQQTSGIHTPMGKMKGLFFIR
jgi:hypothetical protein